MMNTGILLFEDWKKPPNCRKLHDLRIQKGVLAVFFLFGCLLLGLVKSKCHV